MPPLSEKVIAETGQILVGQRGAEGKSPATDGGEHGGGPQRRDPAAGTVPACPSETRTAAVPRSLVFILLLGAVARTAYLALTELTRFDPWRHLKLVENVRSGRGFTLFDGQPYIWHHPLWYYLCAALPPRIGGQWLAGLLSLLLVALVWRWVRALQPASPGAALSAALLTALFGPLISFSCHLGPESFALTLVFAALVWVCVRPGALAATAGGVLFGLAVAVRINFAFNLFLFLPFLATRRRAALWIAGAALPLGASWWRNHQVIASYPWVFTWDGLATRSADFDALSTLVIQMHPAVREGLVRLHAYLVPVPLWFRGPDGISWGSLSFLLLAAGCLIVSRRLDLALAGFMAAGAFLLFDRSVSANFFRVWLGAFPAMIAGAALAADRLRSRNGGASRVPSLLAGGLVAFVLACGAGELFPQAMYPVEAVTPPPELLGEEAYLVNSGFYHPEAAAWRYPEKRFIGLPVRPAEVDEFLRAVPGYRAVLWHSGGIQEDVARYLMETKGYDVVRRAKNTAGLGYVVLMPRSPA